MLGSDWARARLARWISGRTGVELRIGSLDLTWGGPLEVGDLEVLVADGEFVGERIVRLKHASLEAGLWKVIRGPEAIRVRLDGLHLTLDERGNGRTSLDTLLLRYFPPPRAGTGKRPIVVVPRDVPPTQATAPKLPEIEVTVTDCSVRVRRFGYVAPSRRINPFEEDIPIRALDAHADEYALETSRIDIAHKNGSLHVRVDGGFAHGSRRTPFNADVTVTDGIPHGSIEIDSFDLAMIAPLVPGRLEGLVTLRANGGLRDGNIHASLQLEVRDLRTERLDEKRVHARVRFAQDDEGYDIHELKIESDSGRFAADGDLHLPKRELHRPSGHLRGKFPLAVAYGMFAHKKPTVDARVRFDLTSSMHRDGGHGTGTIHLDHFTKPNDPGEIALTFDVTAERRKRLLRIEKCDLATRGFEVRSKGVIHHGARWSADLSGSASGDLARLHDLASHFSHALARTALSGQASFTLHALNRKQDGTIAIHCAARATDVVARGMGADIRSHPDLRAEFDGTLTDGGRTLIVNSARLQELELTGRASGLRTPGVIPESSGTLHGSLKFTPTLMRLLDAEVIKQPRGDVSLDLKFETSDGRAHVKGKLRARDVYFRAGGYVHDDARIECAADVEYGGDALSGRFELDSTHLFANVREFRIEPAQPRITARGNLRVKNPGPLRRYLLGDSWKWAGTHVADDVEFEYRPDAMDISGTVTAPRLHFAYDGKGIDGEKTTVRVRIHEADGRWVFDDSRVEVADRGLSVHVARFQIDADGAISGRAEAKGRLESLQDRVMLLDLHGIHGDAEATVDFKHRPGAPWTLSATAGSRNIGMGHASYGAIRFEAKNATIGERIRARVEATGDDFFVLTRLAPHASGGGKYDIKAGIDMPRPGADGPVTFSCDADIDRLDIEGVDIEGVRIRLRHARFEPHTASVDDLAIDATLDAKVVRRNSVVGFDVHLDHTGQGSLRRDGTGAGYTIKLKGKAKHLRIDARDLHGLSVECSGNLKSLKFEHRRAVRLNGTLAFDGIPGAAAEWTDGSARFSLERDVLGLTDLRTKVRNGDLRARGRIDFRGPKPIWRIHMEAKDAELDKAFTDPLSYIIPILHVADGGNSSASGFVSWNVDLRGRGFAFDDLVHHLRGGGNLRLRDTKVGGSLLLPLLSLRIGKLLLKKPFEIPDSTMKWTVRNGKVTTEPISLSGRPFRIRLGGSVTLRGELDYIIHPGILLVPLRLSGHWDNVTVRPTTREILPKWPWTK